MRPFHSQLSSTTAVFAIAEIKAAVEVFDRGDSNVFDALTAIIVAVEAYQGSTRSEPRRDAA